MTHWDMKFLSNWGAARLRCVGAALSALVLLGGPLVAQTSTITGTVIGNDGKPIESASVRATRGDSTTTRESITDARGIFRLAPVTVGVYTVTVHRVGYRSAELSGI